MSQTFELRWKLAKVNFIGPPPGAPTLQYRTAEIRETEWDTWLVWGEWEDVPFVVIEELTP